MLKSAAKFVIASLLYLVFAVFLYQPYFKSFHKIQFLLVICPPIASAGLFLLSRRWVSSFAGSFFASAIYGFSPFFLNLTKFHPAASLLAASIPWLFLPAAFGPKGKWRFLRIPLSLLPFLTILVFFQVTTHLRLFAVPINAAITPDDSIGILSPLAAAKSGLNLVSLYHIPLMFVFLGFVMLIKARRVGAFLIIIAGITGCLSNPILGVSPIIWLTTSFVCFAILVGAGIDGLVLAGKADRDWLFAGIAIMLFAALFLILAAKEFFPAFSALGAGLSPLFFQSAKFYLLGSAAAAAVFILIAANLRLTLLRFTIISCCLALDILISAQLIVDSLFTNIN
jgi:hypothetical protein